MAKYRKKPVIIEAEQWVPGARINGVYQVDEGKIDGFSGIVNVYDHAIGIVKTLEGNMIVMPGDYIITGVKGEKYPCKPDIFDQTYELVE